MRLRRHFHDEQSKGIDLAPMLDIVHNLLIFIIITAGFVNEFGPAVNRPGGATAGSKEAGSIVVSVRADGEIVIDERIVDVRAVRANVERLHALQPEHGVVVVADPDAETGVVVQVVDQVRLGGVENVSFATTSESE